MQHRPHRPRTIELYEICAKVKGLPGAAPISTHNLCRRQLIINEVCVSLTLTGLVSAWRRGEAPSTILAKPLSDCVTVLCMRQCKSRHLKVCKILKKNTSYFQTNWMSCILNWGVRCDVSDEGYFESLPFLSVEDGWSVFKAKLQSTIDKCIPSRMTSSRQHLPWITPTIRRMVKQEQRLYNRAKKSGRTKHWDMFHCLKRDTRKALRNAHNKYLPNIITTSFEENNTNIFWRYVKAQRQDSTGVAPLKRDGQLHNRNKEKAEILSDQFK